MDSRRSSRGACGPGGVERARLAHAGGEPRTPDAGGGVDRHPVLTLLVVEEVPQRRQVLLDARRRERAAILVDEVMLQIIADQ